MRHRIAKVERWCAYTHLAKVCVALIRGEKISKQAEAGRNIALLGFFCPFFWIALLSGAEKATLLFHATHSAIVFLVGVAIMVVGLNKRPDR